MLRIPTYDTLGQLRIENDITQFSTEEAFRKAGLRPDLGPSDAIPMGIKTSWVNPGEKILLQRGQILPLTPLGPEATNVFPGVYPAPADTQDISYEDRIPRIEDRGDQILRSRSGVRGPAQYWKYGGGVDGLGQPELDPIMFYADPSEVAYQTYPGPFLGAPPGPNPAFIEKFFVALAAVGGSFMLKSGVTKDIVQGVGLMIGGIAITEFILSLYGFPSTTK